MSKIFYLTILTFLVSFTSSVFAQTITSTTTGGIWNVGTTWVGGVVPGPGNTAVIAAGAMVTVSSDQTVGVVTVQNSVGNGHSTLTISDGVTLTVTGAFSLNAGTNQNQATLTMGAGATLSAGSLAVGTVANAFFNPGTGTVILTSTSTVPTFYANFNNLVLNAATTFATGTRTINNLTVNANTSLGGATTVNGNLNLASGTLTTGANTLTIAGTLTQSGGNIAVTNGGTVSLTGAQTYDINSSTFSAIGTTTTINVSTISTLRINGTGNSFPAFTTANLNNSLVIYNGTDQLVAARTYGRLELNGAGTTTAAAGTITASALTINPGVVFNAGSTSIVVNGAFVNAGTLTTTGNLTISGGSFTNSGTLTVNEVRTQGTTTICGTFDNLRISTGTTTASCPVIVTGTLFVESGAILNMGTNDLVLVNPQQGTGTIRTQSAGATPLSAGITWAGTVVYDGAAQTVVQGTYANLTLSGGTKTASGVIWVPSTGTITNSTILDMGSHMLGNGSFTPTITNTGTIRTANTDLNPIPGVNYGGTVEYYATADQNVMPVSYANLVLNGGNKTALNPITITTSLVTGSTVVLNMQNHQLLGAFTATGHAGIIRTQNISATPVPAGKTWGGTVVYDNPFGGQTVMAGTYNNLTLSNTSGTNSPGNNFTVNGVFTTTAGGTLDMGVRTITFGGSSSIVHNGLILTQALSGAFTSGVTFGGTGTVNYNSTAAATIVPANYYNLTISGGRTTSNVTFSGTYGIAGTLNTAAASYSPTGFLVVTGSTFNFNGTTPQIIPILSAPGSNIPNPDYVNVTISGGSTKTLNSPINISGVLNLVNGVVITDGTNLLTMLAGSSVTGGSAASYVQGPMRKIGNTAFTFPLGTAGIYAPITRSAGGAATDAFVAQYFRPQNLSSTVSAPLDHVSMCEYWSVNRTAGTFNPTFTLSFGDDRNCSTWPYVNDLASLRVARFNSPNWVDNGNAGTTGTGASGTITSTTVTLVTGTALNLTLGSTSIFNPLPVKFSSITAKKLTAGVQVNWTIDAEENTNGYEVERSADGVNFKPLGFVKASGSASYSYVDAAPLADAYYRIKAIDFDGKFGYSNVVRVKGSESEVVIKGFFSNRNQISVQHDMATTNTRITVLTAGGQLLKSVQVVQGSQLTQIDVSSAKPGMMIVRYESNGKVETMKLMKQ